MTQNGDVASNGTVKISEELKIVIVGDGGCGKTSLLMVYAKGDFPEVRSIQPKPWLFSPTMRRN